MNLSKWKQHFSTVFCGESMQISIKPAVSSASLIMALTFFVVSKTLAQTPCSSTHSAPATSSTPAAFDMRDDGAHFAIRWSVYEICIPKHEFGLTVHKNGNPLIANVASSVIFMNRFISIGTPSEYYYDKEKAWLELRGWYSRRDNLWYVTRYQFYPDKPTIKVSFSITDRHDNHPSEASWDKEFWHKRVIKDLRFDIETSAHHKQQSIEQRNAYSGGLNDRFPHIVTEANTGPAYWPGEYHDDGLFQITHPRDGGKSAVRIYPRITGELKFNLQQRPLQFPYPSADGVTVNVVSNGKVVASQQINQRKKINRIKGQHTFNIDDYVEVRTTGKEEGDRIVFGAMNVASSGDTLTTITAKKMPDAVLRSQNLALNIKDFAKKHPIRAETSDNRISWIAINKPTFLYGGSGFTLDFALSLDEQSHGHDELQKVLDEPPALSFPEWWLALDGAPSTESRYLNLLRKSYDLIQRWDVLYANDGWKNYGDYQISNSYHDENGEAVITWAALQYDLTLGMMLGWASTTDKRLWDRARAAVRNVMDVQVVKFHPYSRKQSGAGVRKGTCPIAESHWCTPAIPEYNYHTRSLLLYSHLTGELWPKEIARMQIDNSAYFALTRTEWTTKHDRIGGWALRNLYYGHVLFGSEGTRYITTPEYDFTPMPAGTSYKKIANKLVDSIVSDIESSGGLSGDQPVWSAQVVEGLIITLENDMLGEDLKKRTLKAIEIAVNKVAREQIFRKDGVWSMVYYNGDNSKQPELSNLNNYGWFWLNSLVWVSNNTTSDHTALSLNLKNWLIKEFEINSEVSTPRAWSGLMAFPSYAINELSQK